MDSIGCGGCSWCWVSSQLVNWRVLWHVSLHCSSAVLYDVMSCHPSGLLLFLRGFINYARIRKMADSLSNLPRTRVLFIYWAHSPSVRHHLFPPFSVRRDVQFHPFEKGEKNFFFSFFYFPHSAWHVLDNTKPGVPLLVWYSECWQLCKTFQSLVVNCHVLSAILRCVMYKWMPYLLSVGGSPVQPPGGSLVCVIFQELLICWSHLYREVFLSPGVSG